MKKTWGYSIFTKKYLTAYLMFQKSGPLAIGQVFWKKAPFLIFVPSQLGNRGFFHGFIPAEFWRCSTEKNPWKSSFPKSIGWRWSFPTYQTWPHDPPSFVSRLGRLPGSRLSSSKLTSLNLNVRKVKFWGEAPPKTDRYKWGDRLYHPYKLVFFHPPSYPSCLAIFCGVWLMTCPQTFGDLGVGEENCDIFLLVKYLWFNIKKNMLILEDLIETNIGGISPIFLSNF